MSDAEETRPGGSDGPPPRDPDADEERPVNDPQDPELSSVGLIGAILPERWLAVFAYAERCEQASGLKLPRAAPHPHLPCSPCDRAFTILAEGGLAIEAALQGEVARHCAPEPESPQVYDPQALVRSTQNALAARDSAFLRLAELETEVSALRAERNAARDQLADWQRRDQAHVREIWEADRVAKRLGQKIARLRLRLKITEQNSDKYFEMGERARERSARDRRLIERLLEGRASLASQVGQASHLREELESTRRQLAEAKDKLASLARLVTPRAQGEHAP